jgi:hypothetical protein
METEKRQEREFLLAGSVAALVSFLPFARMFLGGQSFFFRDLSAQFFPWRRFVLDGLWAGEWRFWNPLIHGGEPVALSPFGYLPDLLQLLVPNEFGISLFLALHIPLAAFLFTRLARELGLSPVAALAGGLVYGLGGFALSSINLYVYVQTIAWAPLLVLAFRRAVETGGPRAIAFGALALGMLISTTGLEVALQACVIAAVISPPHSARRILRSSASALLGLGLAAGIALPLLAVMGNSQRGSGFATATVLEYSIHPLTVLQTLLAGLYGDTSNLTGIWWGDNFFPEGFPYVLSLYLGPTVVGLAIVGALAPRPLRRRLIVLTLFAAILGLGSHAGLGAFFDLSPSLRFLRYPVKAFFTVHFSIALLASFGVDVISRLGGPWLTRAAAACVGLGTAFVGLRLGLTLAPHQAAWLVGGLAPPHLSSPVNRGIIAGFVASDAAAGGMVAIVAGALCLLARQRRLSPTQAAAAITALISADLVRAGAGLNPSVTSAFYQLSPEMSDQLKGIRGSGEVVFSCDAVTSPSYWKARLARGVNHEAFSMATLLETLTPDFSVSLGVQTAMSPDRSGLVPSDRALNLTLASCSRLDLILPSLQAAGVTRVVSVDPLTDKSLRLLSEVTPARISPLQIRIYELTGSLPRFNRPATVVHDRPGTLELDVTSEHSGVLIVRDSFDPGWKATVNGQLVPMRSTASGHREVSLPAGRSNVRMDFEPRGLRAGVGLSLTSAIACVALLFIGNKRARAQAGSPPTTTSTS